MSISQNIITLVQPVDVNAEHYSISTLLIILSKLMQHLPTKLTFFYAHHILKWKSHLTFKDFAVPFISLLASQPSQARYKIEPK